ncbi:hypothetical protein ACFS07_18010 [Undibacterium arcticum]
MYWGELFNHRPAEHQEITRHPMLNSPLTHHLKYFVLHHATLGFRTIVHHLLRPDWVAVDVRQCADPDKLIIHHKLLH